MGLHRELLPVWDRLEPSVPKLASQTIKKHLVSVSILRLFCEPRQSSPLQQNRSRRKISCSYLATHSCLVSLLWQEAWVSVPLLST